MAKKGLFEIACVLDRSGSMSSMKEEAIGALNNFLKEQKEQPGEATMTLCQFDDRYEVVHDGVDIKAVEPLTDTTYVPRGSTALLDAVGRTINQIGKRLGDMDEKDRPERVLFVIVTDGQENASKEFKLEQIKGMITHQKDKYQWEFVFLAAGPDAFAGAMSMGVGRGNVIAVACNAAGYQHGTKGLSKATSGYRSTGVRPDWSKKSQK